MSSLVNFYDYLSVETKYLCLNVKRDENVIVQNNLMTKWLAKSQKVFSIFKQKAVSVKE